MASREIISTEKGTMDNIVIKNKKIRRPRFYPKSVFVGEVDLSLALTKPVIKLDQDINYTSVISEAN